MLKFRSLLIALLVVATAVPATAYTVYLKDGTRLIARVKPRIEGNQAIILLQSGTETSLAAAEIDFPRSEKANQSNLGTALVLDNGEFTDTPQGVEVQKQRMTDIASGNRTLKRDPETVAPRVAAPSESAQENENAWNPVRKPYRNLDLAGQIMGVFRAHGVDSVQVLQGSQEDRILLDITTDSEGSIFRALEAASAAMVEIRSEAEVNLQAFELLMMTSNRGRAGRFVIGPEMAEELASKQVDPNVFFVQNVRF